MKKSLLLLIPALAMVFLISSCSKDDPTPPPAATPEGTWVGTGQYGTGTGNPTYAFTLTFKANGTVDIIGNNNAAIDNATGTWALVQDSVKATYTYVSASATYSLSAKYSASSNLMVGTIGLATATTGIGTFSVTRQ
ncbi:MAG: hypothetical protein WAR78_13865 [Ferruginibacter sp.]